MSTVADTLARPAATLRDWTTRLLIRVGLSAAAARAVGDNLLYAERIGVRTHGLVRLPIYVQRIQAGGIVKDAEPSPLIDRGAVLTLDCGDGPGAYGALVATDLACARAREYGVAVVVGTRANHFGAAGFYVNRLADLGLVGLIGCNTDIVMAPPGGGKRVLGTNPLAIAVPAKKGQPRPVLDMATSEVAYGKLIVAAQEGRSIPETWAVDRDGKPTTDASAGLAGALLPAAGPKGFGLAFMIDLLSALGGAAVSPDVSALYGQDDAPQNLGFFLLAIDPAALDPGNRVLRERLARLTQMVQNGRSDGSPNPMIPGEPERRFAETHGNRIQVTAATAAELSGLGKLYRVPFPI